MATVINKNQNLADYVTNVGGPMDGKKLFSAPNGYVSDTRNYSGTPLPGYGGLITLERAIVTKTSTGGQVDIWIGRWMGNSGGVTVTWEALDGSLPISSMVNGYAGLDKTVTFADGEHGWLKVSIPLQSWQLVDWEYFVFRVTNVTIDNAAEFYNSAANECYICIDDKTVVNQDRLFCDKDHPSASDSNPGTSALPFLTTQKLLDEINTQQKRGYIVAAASVYEELRKKSGSSIGGTTLDRDTGSGYDSILAIDGLNSAGERTTNFVGRPILDNSFQKSEDPNNGTAGFYVHRGGWFWLRDIEVRNCETGVVTNTTADFGGVSHFICERVSSHGIVGEGNIAAFRFDNSESCIMHNCEIYDTFDSRIENIANPFGNAHLTAGQYNGQNVYAGHNGFQAFGAEKTVIEFCYFHDLRRAIYAKEQRDLFGLDQSVWVRNNHFERIVYAAYDSANQGAAQSSGVTRGGAKNIAFMFNTVYRAASFVSMVDGGATSGQADGAFIFNNSGYSIDGLFGVRGVTGVRCADNIIDTPEPDIGNVTPKVVNITPAENLADDTFVDLSTSNVFANMPSLEFNIYGSPGHQETTLAGWQTVFTDHAAAASLHMAADPEVGSTQYDPLFVDPESGNFARSSQLQDGFLGGSVRGAVVDDSTVIGRYI